MIYFLSVSSVCWGKGRGSESKTRMVARVLSDLGRKTPGQCVTYYQEDDTLTFGQFALPIIVLNDMT